MSGTKCRSHDTAIFFLKASPKEYADMTEQPNMMNEPVSLQISQDFDELDTMQQEWDAFVDSCDGDIYMTFDWLRIWWRYYGKNRMLRIFIFRSGAGLIGIIPLFFETLGIGPFRIKTAKIVGADFMSASLSLPIHDLYLEAIADRLIHELTRIYPFDVLCLGAFSGLSRKVEPLFYTLKKYLDHFSIEKRETDVQSYIQVYSSFEEYTARLNKREREKTRRVQKELQKQELSLHSRFASDVEFSTFFESFVEIHQKKWQKEGNAGYFIAWPLSYEFNKEVALRQLKLGRLRLQEINLNDKVVGYIYAFRFGQLFTACLDARNDLELSWHLPFYRLAFTELIREAIKEKMVWIDLGRGRYEHKVHLGGIELPIYTIFLSSKHGTAKIRIKLFRTSARVLHLLYYKLWRARLAPALKVTPKPFKLLWIRTHLLSD